MKRFFSLLRKDLETSKLPILFNSGLAVVWITFLRYRYQAGWPIRAAFALMFVPLTFLPIWLMWQTYQTLRVEWREKTTYTMLLLPVPGWQIMLSKLVALLIEFTAVLAVFVGSVLVLFYGPINDSYGYLLKAVPLNWLIRNGILLYLGAVALFSSFVIFVQLAFIVGKLVGRFRGLVALWTMFIGSWLVERIGIILQPLFGWVPHLQIDRLFRLDVIARLTDYSPEIAYDYSAKIGSWLATIGLFILSSWLLENWVETDE
ncbi:MAG TPA: hypothetical protein GX019_04305 [Firmicutes bacterium]|jgi:MFS family permease|nr:hypothetical protein [Bacillota bacterium]